MTDKLPALAGTDGERRPEDSMPPRSRPFTPSFQPDDLTAEQVRELPPADRELILAEKQAAVTYFTVGLEKIARHVGVANEMKSEVRALPSELRGVVRQPDGSAAERVSVTAAVNNGVDLGPGVLTDSLGVFRVPLPAEAVEQHRRSLITSGLVDLVLHGDRATERVARPLPAPGGAAIGEVVLSSVLPPLPRSVIGALLDIVDDVEAPVGSEPSPQPPVSVQLGQGPCAITFDEDKTQRRYPYRLLVRLVEPRTTTTSRVFVPPSTPNGMVWPFPLNQSGLQVGLGLGTRFVDRVPVERPISADGFRDQLVGNLDGTISVERTVPMAGTLGLGYVLNLAQTWRFSGLSLGNLIYSLPLAPGEQQRIAISEQAAAADLRDDELVDVAERQQSSARQNASSQAVFQSAFHEHVRANSSYENSASNSSWGVAGGIGGMLGNAIGSLLGGIGASGGGGSSENSGSTRSALDGARQYTASTAESMHTSVEREASARRRSGRTAIRMATETESQAVTTKVMTNHNRTRALTIQYWEVLRHFRVGTDVEGVTLVCFVPMDVIRFLPANHSLALDPEQVDTRAELISRYGLLHRHADAIQAWLPSRHREGMRLLDDFMANPRSTVDLSAPASTVMKVSLQGTFMPFETVYVSARLRSGAVLPRVPLDGSLTDLVQADFVSRSALVDELKRRRSADEVTMTATLSLPENLDPSEVVGFQLSRSFRTVDYQLKFDQNIIDMLKGLGVQLPSILRDFVDGVRLRPGDLEGLLGGPLVHSFSVIVNTGPNIAADGMSSRRELPSVPLPIPALERQPELNYRDVLKIERTLQHVVRNTMTYSKAVWASLTPEERVVMLEGFTIGLPTGGLPPEALTDPSQHIPLLNCVANQVLGFYGNCMILPFSIPPALATQLGGAGQATEPLTTGRVQQALAQFHKTAFAPPVSHVSLPTAGVLGEAVLGQCPSAEKIDLTRFWNWNDAPGGDTADQVNQTTFGARLDPGALSTPDSVASPPTIINNNAGTDAPQLTSALSALIDASKLQQPFDKAYLGHEVLNQLGVKTIDTAEKARADALGKANELAGKAMEKAAEIYKAKAESDKATAEKKDADAKTTATEKAAAEKAAVEKADADAKQAAAKADAGHTVLKNDAAAFLAAASGQPNQAAADALAKGIVGSLLGDPAPPAVAARLFAAFDQKTAGGDQRTQGSKAFLRALGLLTDP